MVPLMSRLVWVLVSAVSLAACSDGSTRPDAPEPMDGFDREAMLAHLATNVLLAMQVEAAQKIALVPPAIAAYCDALATGAEPAITTARDGAHGAFAAAMLAWETTEAVLVGPAAMDGAALRDLVSASS